MPTTVHGKLADAQGLQLPVTIRRHDAGYIFGFPQGQKVQMLCTELRARLDSVNARYQQQGLFRSSCSEKFDSAEGIIWLTRYWFEEIGINFPETMALHERNSHGQIARNFNRPLRLRFSQGQLIEALDWADRHAE